MTTPDPWDDLEELVASAARAGDEDPARTARCLDLMEALVDAGQLGRLVERYAATPCLDAQRALTFLMAVGAGAGPDPALRDDVLAMVARLPGADPTALTNLSTAAQRLAMYGQWDDADGAALDGVGHLVTRALDSGAMPAAAALDLLGRLCEDGVFDRMSAARKAAVIQRIDGWRGRGDPLIDLSLVTLTLPGASAASE